MDDQRSRPQNLIGDEIDVADCAANRTADTGNEASKAEEKQPKTQSKAARERHRLIRLAKQFPNGPEAKQLASMEKPMPASLHTKIVVGSDYALWSEAFAWLGADLRKKARNGTNFYPKLVIKKWIEAYPIIELTKEELAWLTGWISFLNQVKAELRSGGKFGPGNDLLITLGAKKDVLGAIDNLDKQKPAPGLSEQKPTSIAQAVRSMGGHSYGQTHNSSVQIGTSDTVPEQPIASIDDLPRTPRDIPFTFSGFHSPTAKAFWRAYWNSNVLTQIQEAGRMLAADPGAKDEMRKLGEEAEAFFVKTMAKLRIPLS